MQGCVPTLLGHIKDWQKKKSKISRTGYHQPSSHIEDVKTLLLKLRHASCTAFFSRRPSLLKTFPMLPSLSSSTRGSNRLDTPGGNSSRKTSGQTGRMQVLVERRFSSSQTTDVGAPSGVQYGNIKRGVQWRAIHPNSETREGSKIGAEKGLTCTVSVIRWQNQGHFFM